MPFETIPQGYHIQVRWTLWNPVSNYTGELFDYEQLQKPELKFQAFYSASSFNVGIQEQKLVMCRDETADAVPAFLEALEGESTAVMRRGAGASLWLVVDQKKPFELVEGECLKLGRTVLKILRLEGRQSKN